MIITATSYFDDKELSVKEAVYSATAAIKHRPQERGAFDHQTVLPNGKAVEIQCNEAASQIRVSKINKEANRT